MALRRRRLLGSVVALCPLLGCLGAAPTDEGGRSTADASPADSPCEVTATVPSAPDGPTYPTHPESASLAAAETFALDFEAAYQRHDVLSSNADPTYLAVKNRVVERSESTEDGVVVAVRLDVGYGFTRNDVGETETAVPVHADYAAYATYVVGPTRAVRAEREGSDDGDPRTASDGTVVACAESATPG